MYRGTHPRNKKHSCPSCTLAKKSYTELQQTPQEPPAKMPRREKEPPAKMLRREKQSPAIIPRRVKAPRSKSQLKRGYPQEYPHIFYEDQEGGRVQLIAPVRAAVEQAKAMLARQRRCRRQKGCKLRGGRKKVYNPKRIKRISRKTKRRRKHGRQ